MRRIAYVLALGCGVFALPHAVEAAVRIQIDLSNQTMHVTSGSGEEHSWAISSARSGYSTPRGTYRAQRLERMHYSSKYHNSPMPHSIFFRGGYAIHGTGSVAQLGRPASHGCIRLSPSNAATLYSMVQAEGARISISGSPPVSRSMYAHHHYRSQRAVYSAGQSGLYPLSYVPFTGHRGYFGLRPWLNDPSGRD